MRKATKKQALAVYDRFHGSLRCHNGGTKEENEAMAGYCLARLEEHAAEAAILASNPGKLLKADVWLWESISKTIPARVASFKSHYNL